MIQAQLSSRIAAFASELDALIRRAALEAVSEALGGGAPAPRKAAAPAARARGRRAVRAAAPAAKGRPAPKARGGGGRARPELDAKIIEHVKGHAGSRVEEIAKAIGVPSPQVKDRMAGLLEGKRVRKTGQTRGTKYFAL